MAAEPYHGAVPCQAKYKHGGACRNLAYWSVQSGDARYVCGVHSTAGKRRKLDKDPNAARDRDLEIARQNALATQAAAANKAAGKPGDLRGYKMRMMKPVDRTDGYTNVFPNYRHQNRRDGLGCKALSPMCLGPVEHNEPGVPVSKTIENYHQFSKVFVCEVDQETRAPLESWFKLRDEAFADPTPRRHKYPLNELYKMMKAIGAPTRNIPLYALHVAPDGEKRRYSYVESRWFYCHWYERLAKQTAALAILRAKLSAGVNLTICGYDAFDPDREDGKITPASLYKHYVDESRPFGHELVLITLLAVEDPAEYPWNVYFRAHRHLYE